MTEEAHGEMPIHVFRLQEADLEDHGSHAHVGHVLSFLWGGAIAIEHGTRLEARAMSVVVVPAGTPHHVLGGSSVTLSGLSFCSSCMGLTENDPLMQVFRMVRRGAFPVFRLDASRRERISHLLVCIEEELATPSRHSQALQRALILLVLGEVDRALCSFDMGVAPPDELVSSALRFIEEHSSEPISLSDVASAVGRTRSHVAKCVKNATGYTVGQWIVTRKVMEAASLLTHTDLGLEAIADRVGWSDATHLIRHFKKYHGETPAAWRRSHASRTQ